MITPSSGPSIRWPALLVLAAFSLSPVLAQPGGFGGRGGGGGPGGNQERLIVDQFDADKNGRLNTTERAKALESLANQGAGGGRGRGGGGGRGGTRAPSSPGVKLTPADVKNFPASVPLYDAGTLRTFFIELENPNWEAELVAFNNTDVEVPAKITVDGKAYPDVGVHFRGNSSFGVGNGYKRSLNLTFDSVHKDQALLGYRTLNFLNANGDPTFLRSVLSMHIARQYLPAPRANLVRVVINGENWGIYANAQQFNKEWISDNFKTTKGTRWKVPTGGGNGGGFRYAGADASSYRSSFQLKSKEEPAAWEVLIKLARTLQDTPPDQLEAALAPLLDVDGYLRFLALDNAMSSGDGFYTRVADYSLYLDASSRLHFVFHDANEMFSTGGGGGRGGGGPGGGGGGGGGISLNPLVSANDASKPIIAKVLAVPALRAKYLGYIREIAEKSFDWKTLGPVVKQYRDLIADDVARDTRKLFSTDEFLRGTADDAGTLRNFFEQRRAFLLNATQ